MNGKIMDKLNFIALGLMLVLACGCEDFLDRQPNDYLGAGDFYKNTSDLEGAVIGCYHSLHEIINTGQFFLTENRSDNAKYDPTRSAGSKPDERSFSILSVMPTNTYVTAYWAACYHSIARCNLVLANLDVVDVESLKAQFEAEVKFIRGLVYFNLVRLFEGVPLITTPITGDEAAELGRSSADAVYDQLIADLQDAVTLLPEDEVQPYGAAGKWAAKALLAKVYLTRGDRGAAEQLLEDIVLNSGYELHTDFAELFDDAAEVSQNEIMFAVRFTGGGLGLGSSLANYFAPKSYLSTPSLNHNWPSGDLDAAFKATSDSALDTRYASTIGYWDVSGEYFGQKFVPDDVPVAGDDGTDFPVIRYADILLMLAEVKGQGEGLPYLNQVRARAGTFELTDAHIGAGLMFGNYQEAVLNERRLELAFEDDRFFDLLRMGKAYATGRLFDFYTSIHDPEYTNDPDNPKWPELETNPDLYNDMLTILGKGYIEEFRLVLPIPQNDILRGVMEQNEGY
jgi:hypothetical protein